MIMKAKLLDKNPKKIIQNNCAIRLIKLISLKKLLHAKLTQFIFLRIKYQYFT